MKKFLAGTGTALLFKGQNLIGVAKTLTESSISFAVTAEEIRAGRGNALFGRYFHDSSMSATLTDAMFDISYMGMTLGVNVRQGGLSIKEEGSTVATANQIPITATPTAVSGALIGWYQKPGADDNDWTVGIIKGTEGAYYIEVTGAKVSDKYCVKYFYQDENARSIIVPAQFVPDEIHVVIITDLFSGDPSSEGASTVGRLIVDIPRFALDGSQDLTMNASSAATVSLSGSALAVTASDASCETDSYYATITEELTGAQWQDNVIALAVENNDIELAANGTETLKVYAVFGNNMASQLKDNSNFTFAVEGGGSSTITVDNNGVVKGVAQGSAYVNVTLTNHNDVAPAFVQVTVK